MLLIFHRISLAFTRLQGRLPHSFRSAVAPEQRLRMQPDDAGGPLGLACCEIGLTQVQVSWFRPPPLSGQQLFQSEISE
jgi:hypothetical protein